MLINRIDIYTLNVPFVKPLQIAMGVIEAAENIAVKITTNTGLVGWGEASPCHFIVGDTQQTAYQIAQAVAQLILGKDPLAIDARMREINGFIVGESSTRSAYDMALYDIAAKAANMPLYQFLGGELKAPEGSQQRVLRTNLTIGIQDSVEQTVLQAQAILDQNFKAIKMKVGRTGLQDVAHVAAVRALAGPDVSIKIDSNQGWDYPTAVANINAMAPFNLQYSEQPLAVWDCNNLARLRDKVNLPICADESVFDDKDAFKLLTIGAADYLNIKLGKSGGIHTALKINAIAESAGAKCMIGCFGESRLALSAAAHLAAAKPNIVFLDLDSAFGFKSDPVIGGLRYDQQQGGVIHLDDVAGHGAAFDESGLGDLFTVGG
ncbi:dipeptide epimerase [Porticoccaceae bacterium]|nr:dipeptide epimerase [Porticoccaceae bacterium]